jgi:hypothetical protein
MSPVFFCSLRFWSDVHRHRVIWVQAVRRPGAHGAGAHEYTHLYYMYSGSYGSFRSIWSCDVFTCDTSFLFAIANHNSTRWQVAVLLGRCGPAAIPVFPASPINPSSMIVSGVPRSLTQRMQDWRHWMKTVTRKVISDFQFNQGLAACTNFLIYIGFF